MSSLSQILKQQQRLSPQQIQLMKLLQIPTDSLEERILLEIQENPALENATEDDADKTLDEKTDYEIEQEIKQDEEEYADTDNFNELDVSEYIRDGEDESSSYDYENYGYQDGDDEEVFPMAQHRLQSSFQEYLQSQIVLLGLTPNELKVAEFLIGSFDDDGYLRRDNQSLIDDLAFRQNIIIDEPSLIRIIEEIQEIDPAGIGARDLQDCLRLQLLRKRNTKIVQLALQVIENYFEAFSKKHYEKITKSLHIDDEELKLIIQEIVHLNPKPGQDFAQSSEVQTFMIPDFYVTNINGELIIELNSKNAPELRISNSYKEMLKDYSKTTDASKSQKEAVLFIKQKLDAAKWFIDAVKQRQETLFLTMQAICRIQEDFFLSGDEADLKPMILKDISDRTSLDISTVSRVVNSKFVQTEFGTFKLKYFFSEALTKDSGEEVSTREVKKILKDEIENEQKQKPLSDDKLTQILQDKGYNVARRTIAKYREQLNIPVARLRKEL